MSLDEYIDALQYSLNTYQLRRTDKIVEVLVKVFSKEGSTESRENLVVFEHNKIEEYIKHRNREAIFEIKN